MSFHCPASFGGAVCAGCGAALPAGSRFCPACGAPCGQAAERFCPGCGRKAEPGAKFCAGCGQKLG